MPAEGWETISLKQEEVALIERLRRSSKKAEVPSRREVILEGVALLAKRQGVPVEAD